MRLLDRVNGLQSDFTFFICSYHEDLYGKVILLYFSNVSASGIVLPGIDTDSQVLQPLAYPLPYGDGILPYPAGEHDSVQPA